MDRIMQGKSQREKNSSQVCVWCLLELERKVRKGRSNIRENVENPRETVAMPKPSGPCEAGVIVPL